MSQAEDRTGLWPLISLVIPVYNVRAYLARCMEGALAQTYPRYEILLVDDGSTDGSGALCDGYAADSRVRVFHQENAGLSAARNLGVKQARGELVAFADSDDLIGGDYLQYLYALRDRLGADIACARMMELPERTDFRSWDGSEPWERLLTPTQAIEMACLGTEMGMSACAKLYPRALLLDMPYPVGRLYEDLATTYRLFDACGAVAVGSRRIYGYVQRGDSIRHRGLDEKQFDGFLAAEELLRFVRERHPAAVHAARVRCGLKAVEYVPAALADRDNGRAYFRRIRAFLAPHVREVLSDRGKGLHLKLCCVMVMLGYYPSKLFWPMSRLLKRAVTRRRAKAALSR